MTSETKKYIELTDVLAFRFRCTGEKCGAELTLPLRSNFSKDHSVDKCPNCGADWLLISNGSGGGSSNSPLLERIAESIKQLLEWPGRFKLTVEIKPDPKDAK